MARRIKKKRKEKLVQAQKQSSQTFFVSEPEIKLLKWSILNNKQKLLQCLKAKYLLSRESQATHSQSCIFNHEAILSKRLLTCWLHIFLHKCTN